MLYVLLTRFFGERNIQLKIKSLIMTPLDSLKYKENPKGQTQSLSVDSWACKLQRHTVGHPAHLKLMVLDSPVVTECCIIYPAPSNLLVQKAICISMKPLNNVPRLKLNSQLMQITYGQYGICSFQKGRRYMYVTGSKVIDHRCL